VIEVEVKINVPDKIFRILKENGKLHLLEKWALDGIEAMLETFTAADLIDPR
jgi:hypothetical protein